MDRWKRRQREKRHNYTVASIRVFGRFSAGHRRKCMEKDTLSSERINGIVCINESKTITLGWVNYFAKCCFRRKLIVLNTFVLRWSQLKHDSTNRKLIITLSVWMSELKILVPGLVSRNSAKFSHPETFQLQRFFIHLFLFWRFSSHKTFKAYKRPSRKIKIKIKIALRAWKVSRAFEKRAPSLLTQLIPKNLNLHAAIEFDC